MKQLLFAWILRFDHALIGPDSDFHALDGDPLSMLEMLAAVATDMPGASTRDALAMPVLDNPTIAAEIRTGSCLRLSPVARRYKTGIHFGPPF